MAKRRDIPKKSNLIGKICTYTKQERVVFTTGILLIFFAVYILICLISFFVTGGADQSEIAASPGIATGVDNNISNWGGMFGARLSNLLINRWIGIAAFLICPFLALCGLSMMKLRHYSFGRLLSLTCASIIIISLFCGFFFVDGYDDSFIFLGGMHGYYATQLLEANIGWSGTLLFILAAILIFAIAVFSQATDVLKKIFSGAYWKKKVLETTDYNEDFSPLSDNHGTEPKTRTENINFQNKEIFIGSDTEDKEDPEDEDETCDKNDNSGPEEDNTGANQQPKGGNTDENEDEVDFTINVSDEEELASKNTDDVGDYDPTLDLAHYNMPTFDLLKKSSANEISIDEEEQNANKQRIIETLNNYGIKISSIKATIGPTVTLYEIIPEAGVRIAKIRNLEDDIALSISAIGIRIIAPIPGKGTIGIEVPNKEAKIVSMHSIIASRKFQESKYDLPIGLGRTISNEVFMIDLAKMPHILVAGATGQGKSVGLNVIITSLLYKKHPSQLKFVLIDPKKVEFNIYAGIEKHFLAKLPDHDDAIVTDISKVVQTLKSVTKEMENRYTLLQKAHTRNIKEYNAKFISRQLSPLNGHYYMPYIVVIVDEFGDLIMTAGKEVELPIARIAQLARAVGIHMIIATQRPSTNVITGIIKANFPARIAFKVASVYDSRTIIDCPGANQLIGLGDMLFSQGSDLIRVQCAFVATEEIENICGYIEKQQGYPEAYPLPEYVDEGNENSSEINLKDRDEEFEEAARLIVSTQQGSTSLLQRKLKLGYNKAGRIMDQLEAAGIVGPSEGSKPRKVLITDLMQLDDLLNNL